MSQRINKLIKSAQALYGAGGGSIELTEGKQSDYSHELGITLIKGLGMACILSSIWLSCNEWIEAERM